MHGSRSDSELTVQGTRKCWRELEGCLQARPVPSPADCASGHNPSPPDDGGLCSRARVCAWQSRAATGRGCSSGPGLTVWGAETSHLTLWPGLPDRPLCPPPFLSEKDTQPGTGPVLRWCQPFCRFRGRKTLLLGATCPGGQTSLDPWALARRTDWMFTMFPCHYLKLKEKKDNEGLLFNEIKTTQ